MINKVAYEHPKKWPSYLPYILFALREVPSESTGCPPSLLVYGRVCKGPLAILKETWTGQRDLPFSLGKSAEEFLSDLRQKLQLAKTYASEHAQKYQGRYVSRYNLRSRDKHFEINDKCLILEPDSTSSKTFARWHGPGTVVEVKSPYSYVVDLNGHRHHVHANKMRRCNWRVEEVTCHMLSVHPYDPDQGPAATSDSCSIIYERDSDFGNVDVVEPIVDEAQVEPPPSQKIDPNMVAHLTLQQKLEFLEVLDRYPGCFSYIPG